MKKSYRTKQGELGSNDGNLASDRKSLGSAKSSLDDAEAFLSSLTKTCDEKAKAFGRRDELRTNEEAALSQAISILNSDEAFSTFGDTKAAATGSTSFLQMQARRSESSSQQVLSLLQKASAGMKSPRLQQISVLIQAASPFKKVLTEIQKMIKVIAEEEKADDEQKAWCIVERSKTGEKITGAKSDITALGLKISGLNKDINDPKEGLLAQIDDVEQLLRDNTESQKTQTENRQVENKAYQANIANLVSAEELLDGARKVLLEYYAKADASFAQEQADPSPPATFSNDDYQGQSAGGNKAIEMLAFIAKNTKAEENEAHGDEKDAQHLFEDSMTLLKEQEGNSLKNLAKLKETLAKKEQTLKFKEKDLKATQEEKKKFEDYLKSIKPGCDFIMANIVSRKTDRAAEKTALGEAMVLIKKSPAHKNAVAQKHLDDLGECRSICEGDEAHVKCKACLADVSVSGYCAGHSGTTGC